MITGDNALTAAFIGQELTFGNGASLFAASCSADGQIDWRDIDEKYVQLTKNEAELKILS